MPVVSHKNTYILEVTSIGCSFHKYINIPSDLSRLDRFLVQTYRQTQCQAYSRGHWHCEY